MQTKPVSGLSGYRHLALEEAGSTNTEALTIARAGDPGKLWVTAGRQVAGRGRRGRQWISEAGNLYASLLLIDPAPANLLANLPLVAAVALHGAIDSFFADRPTRPSIKWPNDILIGNEKLVGILLESEQLPDGRMAVVVGCGVNCAHHPEIPGAASTDLNACGVMVTPESLFPVLAASMDRALSLWNRGQGFPAIRRKWLESARGLGDRVIVNLQDGSLEGYFDRIDDDGNLILRLDSGDQRRISAGDLFFFRSNGVRT